MPGMDGLEFLKTVRDSDNDTPVIIFTGKGREEIAIKAYELGADHYLQKGRDTKSLFYEIIQKINISVEKKQIQRDLDVSRKLYANIFHHLPDPTFVIDSFREMPNPGILEFFSFMNRGIISAFCSIRLMKMFFGTERKAYPNSLFITMSEFAALHMFCSRELQTKRQLETPILLCILQM